ncbi:MAG: transcription termination factor NusA [Candidatus Cloacimonetes bacterium]|nr:transcription termination factor NusA [Candidatus Cloacimonadota bacterium]HNZ06871.1 transcription termination factor NusA [Candidatus Cloacimonadota bacterium]HOH78631.1 transcription termination factor NusA [Candidatus Cloacimonadota bacterium]HPN41296.1 transcription termination factor NusA [Candidatus Cloacimonadota bacterium]
MSANILDAVIKLAAIKQLDKDQIQRIIEEAIFSTLEKRLGPDNELTVFADQATGKIQARFLCRVVELEENLGEISLAEARTLNPSVQLEDMIQRSMSLYEFEPKLVKNAQRLIMEKIKELEDEKIQKDYNKLKNTIVVGKIKTVDENGGYRIDINHTDALLPPDEQIENEYYRVGENIRAYVVNIRSHQSNITIILSRTNPEFVKKLFEAEIPEIYSGQITIRKIVREPGIRTKVELETKDPKLDPISACVGIRGTRIDGIRRELHGEQIDIVVHSDDPEQMIINALGIDGAINVIIERNRAASVIVNEDNKVIAIGKQGKNVKLAAKLTGMKIDIFTSAEFDEKMAKERRTVSHITELDGVTAKIAEALKQAGYTSVQDVFAASLDELVNLEGVGQKTAERLKEAAKYF